MTVINDVIYNIILFSLIVYTMKCSVTLHLQSEINVSHLYDCLKRKFCKLPNIPNKHNQNITESPDVHVGRYNWEQYP